MAQPKEEKPKGGVPKGYRYKNSFSLRVQEEVIRRGEATISQVLGVVGRYISTPLALRLARAQLAWRGARRRKNGTRAANPDNPIHTKEHLIEQGKRQRVSCALKDLVDRGHLRRTAPGVYAAPLPKIYEEPPSSLPAG